MPDIITLLQFSQFIHSNIDTGPWSYPKHEDLATVESDPLLQIFNEQPIDR
jgi:hypothetical protein